MAENNDEKQRRKGEETHPREGAVRSLVRAVKETISESPDEKTKKSILQIEVDAGRGGILKQDLTRKTHFVRKANRAKGDAMNAKHVKRGISEEQIHSEVVVISPQRTHNG